jgi:DNA-directed RNA polymerase specialized sigma24 family protein
MEDLPLDQLCAEARAQERNFICGLPSDDTAGVELFRRAIGQGDRYIWAAVIELYRGLLVAQMSKQVIRPLVVEDDAFCVDRAFQRFWQATRARGPHQFGDLASILKYLKMCLSTVLLDEARARKRQPSTSLEDVPPEAMVSSDPAALVVSRVARRELWQAVNRELHDDAERLVARLSFVAGFTPREIRARHPDYFADVADVYRVKRNVIERLRRSVVILRLID